MTARRTFWVNIRARRYQVGVGRIMSDSSRPHVQRTLLGNCYRLVGRWGVIVLRWPAP